MATSHSFIISLVRKMASKGSVSSDDMQPCHCLDVLYRLPNKKKNYAQFFFIRVHRDGVLPGKKVIVRHATWHSTLKLYFTGNFRFPVLPETMTTHNDTSTSTIKMPVTIYTNLNCFSFLSADVRGLLLLSSSNSVTRTK